MKGQSRFYCKIFVLLLQIVYFQLSEIFKIISLMTTNKLELRSVYDLLGKNFFIPDYQRGYRWTELQVRQLLEDIFYFKEKMTKSEKEFYCLQPVVVKENLQGKYEVIDGQQRLTTIFLILKFIEAKLLKGDTIESDYGKPIFTIDYQVRAGSKDFLENIVQNYNSEKSQESIDFFYMSKAYEVIDSYFDYPRKYKRSDLDSFLSILFYKVKVIWYEVSEDADSIDIFTRLNIGKIPLTNAELIKALLLQKGNFEDSTIANLKQIQIATEWDNIEKRLQDDSFWYFIYNVGNSLKYENRIEYLFDLMKSRTPDSEYYYTFNKFFEEYSNSKKENGLPDIDKIWLNIKSYYLTFEEWYKEHAFFHYIGFLIDSGIAIREIIAASKNKTKIEFKNYLKAKIKKQINCSIDELDDLTYGDTRIKKILLLFNIQTILDSKKSEMRFPFHKYKIENWDIEHVRSQTEKTITSSKQQHAWINDMLDYFLGTYDIEEAKSILKQQNEMKPEIVQLIEELVNFKEKEKTTGEFDALFRKFQRYFKEDEQVNNIENIANLTLLDSTTNRSYRNAFFPIKRKRIIENDANGIFIPIATKNLFLKYYSKHASENMYWTEADARDYLDAIKAKLVSYLKKDKKL